MKRYLAYIISCILIWGLVSVSLAQQQTGQQHLPLSQAPPPVSIQKVKGNIYQVKGGLGANTGFYIVEKEVLVIDAKMNEDSARQMLAEISKLTANPMSFIILTHSDADHVNGLVGFPRGIPIISQEKTLARMSQAFQTDQQRAYLPNITFADSLSLYPGGVAKGKRVDLLYFGPAHTDGDLVAYFPEEKVAFIGDLIFIGRDQLIHRVKNGSSFGLVKVLKAVLNLDADIFAHGHDELATKKDIQLHLQSIEERQARIEMLVKEGKPLDEVKKIFNIVEPPGGARWMSLVEVTYRELSEKK